MPFGSPSACPRGVAGARRGPLGPLGSSLNLLGVTLGARSVTCPPGRGEYHPAHIGITSD
ncbi:hypothetical protein FMEAI12_4480011 [Parafrankia sp. Ea1.12]|nr:hypothetical protein FMEAI12_4480011 [Parafrankia sp. Ea1.12]